MRKLGDQWIEIIDGQEHMVKAVEGKYCQGCMYSSGSKFCDAVFWRCMREGEKCPFNDDNLIVKDLGILKDGLLPCPFCGEYPKVKRHESYFEGEGVKFYIQHVHYPALLHETEQQAIDAWNRRE